MCEITLKGLNFKRCRLWLDRAKDSYKKKDPIDAFICSWIAFNHYFSTYCARDEVQEALYTHAGKKKGAYISDYRQLLFVCDQEDFRNCFNLFRKQRMSLFRRRILLPDKMETMKDSSATENKFSFARPSAKMTITTLNTIRTNLFHGHKDSDDERDLSLCHWAASILILFLDFLIGNTKGEVLDASEGMAPSRTVEPQQDL
jgi:hypothetical protein